MQCPFPQPHIHMNVDFNNVRKQAVYSLDRLTTKLNASKLKESQWAKPNDVHHNQEIDISGYLLIDAETIQDDMDNLRMLIGTIASCFMKDDPEVIDVYKEIYPEGSGKSMVCFNDEDES